MKRAKNSRMRGSKTHGCGSMKKRRGKGHRGGSGKAGTGKRGDQVKPGIWKGGDYFGKRGFPSRAGRVHTINIIDLELRKLGKEQDGKVVVDLTALGYGKLLSRGKAGKKYSITVDFASKKAIEKIQQAGGQIVGAEKKEKPQETEQEA